MFKKYLAHLLVIVIVLCSLPIGSVLADSTAEDFTYTISGGYATITGYTGGGGDVTIPSTINHSGTDYTVITIGDSAFRYKSEITSVTIPEGVLNIGMYAFDSCTGISSPIVIPDSMRVINYGAFKECTNLPSVVLNAGLKIIGDWAFAKCRFTSEMIIPDLVPEIKRYTFCECRMPAITIGKGVTSIAEEAFSEAGWLERITVSSENSQYKDIDGVLFNKSGTILIKFPQSKSGSYIVPDGVETFAKASFICWQAPSITIPASVKNVDELIYGSHVYYIVDSGNTNFDSQEGVLFNEGLTTLLSYGSKEDKTCIIPSSVTKIGENAFHGNSSLESITIPGTVKVIGEVAFHATSLKSITIEEGVETIEDDAFNSVPYITEIIIPSSVNYMGEGVFSFCTNLKSATFKDGLQSLGAGTFNYCTLLESVTLPKSLLTIKEAAFVYCYGLKTITIPQKVSNLGYAVFFDCTSLTQVIFQGEMPTTFGTDVFKGTPAELTAYYPIKHGASWSGFTLCPAKAYCNLTCDLQDGSSPTNTFTVLDSSGRLPVPAVPNREGYTFEGWYKESSLVNAFDFNNESVQDDLTLFAKWSLNDEAIQVAGSSDGTIISMAEGNTLINDSLNSWGVYLTVGTVKGAVGDDLTNDLEVEGLPPGLTWSAKNSGLNSIGITVSGAASSPVNSQTNITVTIKGGAVIENGAKTSNPISGFYLMPYTPQLPPDDDISGDFTDANFKNAIWAWLGHGGTPGSFTKQDLIDRIPEKDYLLDVSRFWVPENLKIKSLNGFEHFQGTGLKKFYCYDNHLGSIPVLPGTLEVLRCMGNQLISLPVLPESLKELNCNNNANIIIPALPDSLEIFDCCYCQLKLLPDLPAGLIDLDCSGNDLTSLPVLPSGLKYLMCNYNWKVLPNLSDLPSGLLRLAIEGCYMTQLPELPASLEILNCPYNCLTTIPTLPDSLIQLWVDGNPITELPELPAGLEILVCESTNISTLPDLPEALKQLQCRWNYLDVFSDPLQSIINLCSATTKEFTPQYRVIYSGNSRMLQVDDTSQLIASDFLHQKSSNGTEWAATTTPITLSDFIFSSSDATVATVNSEGLITATGSGNCEIFADYKGISSKLTRALIRVQVASSTLTVTGTTSDSSVTMEKWNKHILNSDSTWEITVTTGTLRGSTGDDLSGDITVSGLPEGLTWTAKNGGSNKLLLILSGTATLPLPSDATVSIILKGSVVTESLAASSAPMYVHVYKDLATTIVLTNEEGGLIDELIESGYGDNNLWQALAHLMSSSGGVISEEFMEALANCPSRSEIFSATLKDFAGLNNPICINSDGTLSINGIFGRDYYGKEFYLTYPVSPTDQAHELYTYATSKEYYIDAGSGGSSTERVASTTNYKAFAIIWLPLVQPTPGDGEDNTTTNPPSTQTPAQAPTTEPVITSPTVETPEEQTEAPVLEIDDNPIPESPLSEPLVIPQDADAALPKTGGIPATIFYVTGLAIAGSGIFIGRKKGHKKNI